MNFEAVIIGTIYLQSVENVQIDECCIELLILQKLLSHCDKNIFPSIFLVVSTL
jgi:hypothetical protein